ncbi:alpha/beta fold hydrolase [Sinorhizobium alkalisoli]|uniref:Lysophospholipase n=1 Tax=Sinorhizobium alkalisoli TaxID=1752398 RepID=A0A1E3VAB6_9HYPH|nr:alpha/beta hydrolase [Sinorhizobium alkalisoli]MCA1492015.1 alpha/beta hydrolase [Ensifer sp. NBAIM29]ODR90544.1 lysophospholipase [Sinorhizobium alkalisoli]QFI67651.1 Lysophospholipase L2 [Sinorhizobium alkalisoli]
MIAILDATPDNPIPGYPVAGFFDGVGNRKIRYAIFKTKARFARGTVVLLQGRNESIEKYFETIGDFMEAGYWVATFDWRGQGGSERLLAQSTLGHVEYFADYGRDLMTFLEQIVLPDTRLPFSIVAHSMGALVCLSVAPALATRVDRMVLLAPFVGLGGQVIGEPGIVAVAAVMRWLGLGRLPLHRDGRSHGPFTNNPLTRDADRYARNLALLETHPRLSLGPPTARWLNEAFRTIRRVTRREHLTRITVPTVLLAPTADGLVPYVAIERLASNFRAGHLIPIDGARHELLQEADRYRAQAMAAILAFLPQAEAGEDDESRQFLQRRAS